MTSKSSLGSLLLMTTIGTDVTLVPLPYDMEKGTVPMENVTFSSLSETEYTLSDITPVISDEDIKLSIIVGVAKELATNSKDIDPEFVDIVNKHFWELI